MQGHGRIIAPDFCVAHREANSGLSTLNRTKSILSIYHQQRQLQKQRGMCLNDTYPFCQQPLPGNCHSICFSKPVLWTATSLERLFALLSLFICLPQPPPFQSHPSPTTNMRSPAGATFHAASTFHLSPAAATFPFSSVPDHQYAVPRWSDFSRCILPFHSEAARNRRRQRGIAYYSETTARARIVFFGGGPHSITAQS